MKFHAGTLIALLAISAFAADKIKFITVDGNSYVDIQDVHLVSGGRIVLLYASGGTTLTADKLPKDFLASWGIKDQDVASSKSAAAKQAEQSLAQAIRAGYFREVGGVVYDLRKPQAGWVQFSGAQIQQVFDDGALVDPTPSQSEPAAVFVRNLPHIFADNEKASFTAKLTGHFSYVNKFGYEKTIRAYDVGRICARNEIPDAIVIGGQAAGNSPLVAQRRERGTPERPDYESPGDGSLHGIGSGFFITKDGYLLTNYHVVKDAKKVKVKYRGQETLAKVVEVDMVNDLALVKVPGSDFSALSISHKDSADLGDEVFTIGFPNVDMQGVQPKYTDGRISSLAGIRDDAREYQISVPVQPGNSGGPLCDVNGEVVGIVVARLNDLAALRESGAVPQNVNYAVKAKYALHLLQNVKGVENLMLQAPIPHSGKPVKTVEDAIAMVEIF